MKSGEFPGGRVALDSRNSSVSPDLFFGLCSRSEILTIVETALPPVLGSKYFLVFLLVISVLCHFRALFSLEAGETAGARAVTWGKALSGCCLNTCRVCSWGTEE